MRVLFLNHNLVGSGTFFRAFHFGRQLAARGHEVTLVTTSRTAGLAHKRYDRDGFEIIEAPDLLPGRARTGWDPYNTFVRTLLVRSQKFDIVHAFDSRPVVIYPALTAVARNNALFVMDWADWWGRGGWIQDRSGWFVRTAFGPIETWFEEAYRGRAHGMTVISRALGERSQSLGIAQNRIECIPQGCALETTATPSRKEARLQLGLSAQAAVVLHVGVLTPGDVAFLRAAFAKVRDTNKDALLVLAGRSGLRVAGDNSGSIVVTGALEDDTLQAWLAAANVCVIPSRDTIGNRGRWPSKLNDYLAHSRAVVMPKVGDAADFLERARAGWATEATIADFARGMSDALQDPAAADAAGARGRAAAETELAWPLLTDRLVAFYDRLGSMR